MPQTRAPKTEAGHFHAVRFYEDSQSLARMVAGFIAEGLIASQPAIVIASRLHAKAVSEQLVAMAFDVDKLTTNGNLLVLDARETLDGFMVDGLPNAGLFEGAMNPILDKVSGPRRDRVIRAYGEMVDLLWKDGMEAAAVRLEMLWNQLANSRKFSLLCGYSMGSFYKDVGFKEICDQHTHLLSSSGAAAPLGAPKITP
jgi:hypothetical protein